MKVKTNLLAFLVGFTCFANAATALAQAQCVSVTSYGGAGDGVTDNVTPLNNALASLSGTGGCIAFPAGRFVFHSAVIYNFPSSGKFAVSIVGSGTESTVLTWSNTNGLIFVYNGPANGVTVRDMSLTTTTANVGAAIIINNGNDVISATPNLFENLYIRGDDATSGANTEYWQYGIEVEGPSSVNFERITVLGAAAGAYGTGINLYGNYHYGVVYNVSQSSFFYVGVGIVYGNYIQGLTVDQTNFTGGNVGIQANSNELGVLAQLSITNSQFNTLGVGQVVALSTIDQISISNNLFAVPSNQYGLYLNTNYYFTITGNTFAGGGGSSSAGVYISHTGTTSPGGIGTITGNVFYNFAQGVWLTNTSSGTNVQANAYAGCTTSVLNQGTNNKVGVATPFAAD